MLVIALFLTICAGARARTFNITHLAVPAVVPSGQTEVDIECRYDANFTLLSWFKGSREFFRYKPGSAPSTRSYPIVGVGTVEMIACGPTACHLKLGNLTEEATGMYRCDIERDVPPYKFATRAAYMEVHGHEHPKPLLEGLVDEYGEGDMIQAYCRGTPDTELRWYINGQEVVDMRGSMGFRQKSTRLIFLGVPPKVSVQCAEFRYNKIYSSREKKARWKEAPTYTKDEGIRKDAVKMKNGSNINEGRLAFLSIVLCLLYTKLCL